MLVTKCASKIIAFEQRYVEFEVRKCQYVGEQDHTDREDEN